MRIFLNNEKISVMTKNIASSKPLYLLEGNPSTNFIYVLKNINLDKETVLTLNKKYNARSILKYVWDKGGTLQFVQVEGKVFNCNLQMVESLFPEILAEIILISYETNEKNMNVLSEKIEEKNPANFLSFSERKIYFNKINHFLVVLYRGMTTSKIWDGNWIFNSSNIKYRYENNLAQHTILAQSPKEDGIDQIYEKNGEYFIKLNLQIRFK